MQPTAQDSEQGEWCRLTDRGMWIMERYVIMAKRGIQRMEQDPVGDRARWLGGLAGVPALYLEKLEMILFFLI